MVNKKNKILIFGNSGYIGTHFFNFFSSHPSYRTYGFDLNNTSSENTFKGDITNHIVTEKTIASLNPDIIINLAAISNLNICEENKNMAKEINIIGNKNIVDSIQKLNEDIKYIYLSSDYVFEGNKGNYSENDKPNPKTHYGITKLSAENYIRDILKNYAICRSANVYGFGGNFFNFILDSLKSKKKIEVYDNTYFNPTFIGNLIEMLELIIDNNLKGLFHTVGSSIESRYSFALKIAETFNRDKALILPIKKPGDVLISKNSSLNFEKTKIKLKSINFLSTEAGLNEVAKNNEIKYRFCYFDDRGAIINIFQNKIWEEMNYIDSRKSYIRGNHYHKETIEGFYIIKGKIKVHVINIISNDERLFEVTKGDSFLIYPNEIHIFEILEDSSWINLLSKSLDSEPKDFYRLENS
jgi:dTDP-4-dehydrorhamnose reductase